jgi:hypothetical protein
MEDSSQPLLMPEEVATVPLRIVLIVAAVLLLGILAVAVYLVVKLIRLHRIVRSELMPRSGKVAFWAALVYTILPIDLLPDPIYLDDVGVLTAALAYIHHLARKQGLLGESGSLLPGRLPRA